MPSARRHARARGGGSTVQHSNPKKRSRMTFNKGQKRALEEAFRRAGPQYGKCVIDTAHALGVPMVRVRKWFDNRTQRHRRSLAPAKPLGDAVPSPPCGPPPGTNGIVKVRTPSAPGRCTATDQPGTARCVCAA